MFDCLQLGTWTVPIACEDGLQPTAPAAVVRAWLQHTFSALFSLLHDISHQPLAAQQHDTFPDELVTILARSHTAGRVSNFMGTTGAGRLHLITNLLASHTYHFHESSGILLPNNNPAWSHSSITASHGLYVTATHLHLFLRYVQAPSRYPPR